MDVGEAQWKNDKMFRDLADVRLNLTSARDGLRKVWLDRDMREGALKIRKFDCVIV